jgi:hypothetical protein
MFLAETVEKNESFTASLLCCLFTGHCNITVTYQTYSEDAHFDKLIDYTKRLFAIFLKVSE